ncbi:glycosyltransferase [Flavobacterium flavipallidum]|uniref:Glycosyltransferase n=1 Tax=Flavobacterium flavipallidum TaxID=3139140 RepID=A0ABU9HJ70_9FLAO
MRIVQLIDSLDAGGAERMAVNYANALSVAIEFSGLVASRKEGVLIKQLDDKVHYLFLNKKNTVDFMAVLKLREYILKNQIQLIHAHSSSFFLAVLVKMTLPKLKIIWHDHYGNSDFVIKRPKYALQLASYLFNGTIAVNEILKEWTQEYLYSQNGIYLPNFVAIDKVKVIKTNLKGEAGKRILCLANLRRQKNHLMLIEVASQLRGSHPDWTFHLVGKDFQDSYALELKAAIKDRGLEQHVYVYGSCLDVANVLDQIEIAVLTSDSEGLPLAVLEYGLLKKAVITTDVGQLSAIIENNKNGFLVPSNNIDLFYSGLVQLIENKTLRNDFAGLLHQKVNSRFSAPVIIKKYIYWIQTTIVHG